MNKNREKMRKTSVRIGVKIYGFGANNAISLEKSKKYFFCNFFAKLRVLIKKYGIAENRLL